MERSKPTSGLELRVMITLARSAVTSVFSGAGASSSSVHPSSNPSRTKLSNRPLALDCAPRPRGMGWPLGGTMGMPPL